MYGQFQNSVASAAKWTFLGFTVVIVMALLLGSNIREATWLNSDIAAAQAEKTRMETTHQDALNKLQEQLATAETEAEVQKIQNQMNLENAQFEHDIQVLSQDVINRQRWTDTKINLVTFLGNAAIIVVTSALLIIAIAIAIAILRATPKAQPPAMPSQPIPEIKKIPPLPERHPYEPLDTPQPAVKSFQQLHDRRLVERLQELTQQREENVLASRMKAVMDPASISKEEYNKSPLAGD